MYACQGRSQIDVSRGLVARQHRRHLVIRYLDVLIDFSALLRPEAPATQKYLSCD